MRNILFIFSLVFLFSCGKKNDAPAPAPVNPSATRFNINANLVTANPTQQASALYRFFKENYGNRILSGAMTLNSMDEINWLKTNTGKEPAIIGLDFMHCFRNYNWYDNKQPVKDAINYWNRNGIPVFCWHWKDPSKKTEEFYTNKTTFDVSKIFDPSSDEYKAMLKDIDSVSIYFLELQNKNVPVIWRPLHEAEGGWFWWGAKGSAACKKLYHVMFDRMVNYHGLKNLIWVWTSEAEDAAWYPGDEYVDIIGRDIYKKGDHGSQVADFNNLNELHNKKKMIALTECGSVPDVNELVKDKASWLWFMTWYGDFVRNEENNSLDFWKKTLNSSYVITLDEMPSLK